MKSDRLLSILLLLQTRTRVPAAELADRLEVSVRTIYRDVESLSAAGVPVYAERGRHGGIALLPGYRTDVTGLTSHEARALFVLTAPGAHSALGLDGALGSALRKVMAALPAPHRPTAELTSRRILIDPDRWMTGPRPAVDLDVLETAVFTDRRLRIRYRHSGATRPRAYTVDPYGLVAKAGTWYLVADRGGEPRLFRADRIAAATVTDEPVRRRAGTELADVWEALRREVEERPVAVRVRVRVRRSRLDMFVRIVGSLLSTRVELVPEPVREPGAETEQNTERAAQERAAQERSVQEPADQDREAGEQGEERGGSEEWALAEIGYAVLGATRQLLQFGADVEVIDPPEVRAELAHAAALIVALYAPTEERAP
ncbi:helix-turn-helix transcriptional regulator [Streptomyces zagrosensis]|uniref:Putative DNA-binding transcriptional regulator YafY n=1 Tax=Streptomyces zagrosensis TaxID=1042984 RepID=A0A7W9UX06_9ACTN|nr:WYL domain-containing protein [Streptomyces zagrosensis]MBB5934398.1 putative DNA-binding transcriptional regulator YafY [Streptomyces zagrosensis]